MDNINTSFSSTPHKTGHYIPDHQFYHHQYYYSQDHQQPAHPMSSFNLSQEENDIIINTPEETEQNDERQQTLNNDVNDDEKEPMFEKPLTPSDVGKLNRLVIPKQHAERYFPLGGGGGDSGLLLSFEDESGKSWRFRYSYWNSSQSYVLTKGWSRYVKEKRLDAGDVVLFERHRRDGDRLFIRWRRRSSAASAQDSGGGQVAAQVSSGSSSNNSRVFYPAPHPYPAPHHHHPHYHQHHHIPAVPYQLDFIHEGGSSPAAQNFETTTVNNNSNPSKILRLFGVNLECQSADHESSEPSTPDGSSFSSHGPLPHHNFYPHSYYSDHHMDFTFSRDVKAMRDRQG